MNLVEILKNYPINTKLYSPIFGEVYLKNIDKSSIYPIKVKCPTRNGFEEFTEDGRYYDIPSECLLFPSKDNHNWNTFEIPKKKVSETKHQFKPFDKVLVRDTSNEEWELGFFSHMDGHNFITTYGACWMQCIRYEGHEDLLGTTESVY